MRGKAAARVVVVTQSDGTGARLEARLAAAGVRIWKAPVLAYEPVGDTRELDECLAVLARFDWLAVTSARAVEIIAGRPAWREWVASRSGRPRVAAVGAQTAESLASRGVEHILRPRQHGGSHLAQAMIEAAGGILRDQSILWPRSNIARPEFRSALAAAGATVVDPVVYRTVGQPLPDREALVEAIRTGRIDAVTFLSPSSAELLSIALGFGSLSFLAGRTSVASIGPATSEALVRLGAPPAVEAWTPSGDGLAEALLTSWKPLHGVPS